VEHTLLEIDGQSLKANIWLAKTVLYEYFTEDIEEEVIFGEFIHTFIL
jgi:hypothetical protein